MDVISIFTDVMAVIFFLLSLTISFLVYRKVDEKFMMLNQVSSLNFYLCVIFGSGYFVYAMSSTMTPKNAGSYAASLLLALLYAALFAVFVKIAEKQGKVT